MELVLSLFPGIDLLGRAFEAEGFCVVRGPDTIWDQRIEDFHVPARHFNGIIGGPPCQNYSDSNRDRDTAEGDRLVREFLRVVREAGPSWFLMENVRNVPNVAITGYHVQRLDITDCECGGKQKRLRHIQFGSLKTELSFFKYPFSIIRPVRTIAARSVTPAVMCRIESEHDRPSRRFDRQGAPRLPLRALTKGARARAIGNAVPYLVGLTLARAVTERGPVTESDCVCLCGRQIAWPARHATPACRKRMERRRRSHFRTVTEFDLVPAAASQPAATSQPRGVT